MSRTDLISRALALLMWCTGLALLAACDVGIRQEAADGIEEGRRLTAEERRKLNAFQRGEVIREDKPFYGAAVPVKRGSRQGKPLPRALEGARGVALKLSGQSDVRTIAAAITSVSEIPVNIRTRYILDTGDVVEVPIGTRMRVNHEGTLSAFLDQLAARMDVAWRYDGTVLTIDRMVRRTWRVALPLGTTEFRDEAMSAESEGGEGESGGGARGPSVSSARKLDPWGDLEKRLTPLAPPPARVTTHPESGRVEVFGPPSVQKAVGKVLEDVTATANMRIGLDVAVYFVDTNKADQFGVDLEITTVLGSAQGRDVLGGLVTLAPPGGAGLIRLARGDDFIDFEALARDGAVVDYRLASSITQSGVITPLAITSEENYVYSKTIERDGRSTGNSNGGTNTGGNDGGNTGGNDGGNTGGNGGGGNDGGNGGGNTGGNGNGGNGSGGTGNSNTADPGRTTYDIKTLERGLSVTVLPRLIDDRLIQLSLTFSQREGIITTIPGAEGIQSPNINNREIRNQTVLAPGETLILSGYEQDYVVRNDSGLGPFRRIGLGGSSRASTRKVRMILMVRPTLIPQGGGGRS